MISFTSAATQNSSGLFFILQIIINVNVSILILFCNAEKDLGFIVLLFVLNKIRVQEEESLEPELKIHLFIESGLAVCC